MTTCRRHEFSSLRWPTRPGGGFTLIELLVGLVILAVMASAVALTLGRDRGPERLQQAAARAQALITSHCRQNAILQGQVIGLAVTESEYQFVSQQGDYWLPQPDSRVEKLPAGVTTWISLDGRRAELDDTDDLQPQALCLPSGELTPFILHFRLEQPVLRLALYGRGNGRLEVDDSFL